jgi:hypothetical protein
MQLAAPMKRFLWPAITDEGSATTTVRTVSKCIFGWSVFLIAIGLLDLLIISLTPAGGQKPSGTSVASAFVWYTIGVGLIFGVIGWRVKTMSFVWAIVGLSVCVLGAIAVLPSPFGFVIYVFLALVFANAVRATYKYKYAAHRTNE